MLSGGDFTMIIHGKCPQLYARSLEDSVCIFVLNAKEQEHTYACYLRVLEQVKRERHGRWFFKYPNGWACSRCGEWGLMIDNRGIYKSSYCPNCGARMDKEDEHEAG